MLRHLIYPFLPYRSFVAPILLLSAIVVPCWLAFRLYRHRAGGHAPSTELRPNLASLTCSSATLPRGSTAQAFCVHNARGNVMLFIPLGLLIPLVWRHLRFWRGIQIALALSCGIELLQYLSSAWGSYRAADVNDVIMNVFGAGLGLALVWLLRFRRSTHPAVARA